MSVRLLVASIFIMSGLATRAQAQDSTLANISPKLTDKYISSIGKTSDKISGKLDKQTEQYLDRLEKQELAMKKKLAKIDSLAAHNIFSESEKKYEEIRRGIHQKSANLLKSTGQYIPFVDSASTSLKFLQNSNPAFGAVSGDAAKVKAALGKVHELEDQFKQAENIKEFIRQRKEYLKEQLANYQFGSELKKYNQQAYYYAQQVNEYKAALDDPEKLEKKALELLNQVPAFRDFMKKNSMLAGLFNIPDDYATTGLGSLQTRDAVQQMLQRQMASMGSAGAQTAQANILDAQGQLTQLRNKFMQTGSGGEMPDFKPNDQKTKSIFKRLEYGVNLQTQHSTYYFPTTTDVGLSVGYKLNDKSTVGIGLSGKIGWGKDYQHIAVTAQGIGLRSFLDWQIKGSIYASGGLELNNQQVISAPNQLSDLSLWQRSGLIGVTKMVSVRGNLIKKTKVQMFWDFLSYYQIPRSQPFKFRIGYNF